MNLQNIVVVSDSMHSVQKIQHNKDISGILLLASELMSDKNTVLKWESREVTSQADFFATLALNGKSLVAKASNSKNYEDKFRILNKIDRKDKEKIKDLDVFWLNLPNPPKLDFEISLLFSENKKNLISVILGDYLSAHEFNRLVEYFEKRNERSFLLQKLA